MPETINPLRYPGAKRSLVGYIDALLAANNLHGCTFYEPYAGSAAVGLELLQKRRISQLVLCEKDILLYAFWESVFRETDTLCKRIEEAEITVATWQQMLPYRNMKRLEEAELVDLAFAGLFFNRTNFSGILNANPIGGINQTSQYGIACRFNKDKIIEIIRQLSSHKDSVEVYFDDALQFMRTQYPRFIRETCFAYFDPPYFVKGSKIYRHYYTTQDHLALARFVRDVHNLDWIISYDDDPFICGLYGGTGAQYQPFFLDYTCASKVRTQGHELLISNLPLPPFPMSNAVHL